jgi:hypothetical protein
MRDSSVRNPNKSSALAMKLASTRTVEVLRTFASFIDVVGGLKTDAAAGVLDGAVAVGVAVPDAVGVTTRSLP